MLALGLLAPAAVAVAHEVGLSRGEYRAAGTSLDATLVFARKELIELVAGLDENHDGALTAPEIERSRASIEGVFRGRVKVTEGGAPCTAKLSSAELVEQDGAAVTLRFTCPARAARMEVSLGFFDDLAFGHRHLARIEGVGPALDQVLSQRSPTFSIEVPPESRAPADATSSPGAGERALATARAVAFGGALGALASSKTGPRTRALGLLAGYLAAVALGALLVARVFDPPLAALALATAMSLLYAGVELVGQRDGAVYLIPFGVVHGMATSRDRIACLTWSAVALVAGLLAFTRLRPRTARLLGGAIALAGAVDLALKVI